MKLSDYEFSTRAANCLAEAGITEWHQLVNLSCADIAGKRHAGPKTVRELIAACVRNHYHPAALHGVITLGFQPVKPGTVVLAKFGPSERWMMEAAVALLNCEWGVEVNADGYTLCIPSERFVDDGPETE